MSKLINKVNEPSDIKQFNVEELNELSQEIRDLVLNKVSKVGGHIGPNLGIVELTVALHYVFDSPKDKIVWDVSHQSYPHKILTGRKHGFTDGHFDEISGYTNQHESKHDFFTVGHTSTSVSLACGLAKARDLNKEDSNIIAVLGDGSLSGGLAFEGLNNGAALDSNLIVIFNDNEMSIAENHGGLYKNLQELRDSKGTSANNLFKALGFDYYYISDGHNIPDLISSLTAIKDIDHPIVVHVHTEKGHGYQPAVEDKEKYHGGGPFDLAVGISPATNVAEDYPRVILDYLYKSIETEGTPIVAINAAIPGLFKLKEFMAKYPERYIDAGIAEQHTITFASALALQKIKPVVFHSSAFLQRAYDQLSHDLALNDSPAVILVAGGTISGGSKTHQGTFDVALIRNIPNIIFLAPTSKEELLEMLDQALKQNDHPVVIKVPSGNLVSREIKLPVNLEQPKYEYLAKGTKVAIIGLGSFIQLGLDVKEQLLTHNIEATVINPRFISALDTETLEMLKQNHQVVITLEDGNLEGGFGEKISSYYGSSEIKVLNYGAFKEFSDSEGKATLYKRYRLLPELIIDDIKKILK